MIRFACTKCGCGFATAHLMLTHNCLEAYQESRRRQLVASGIINNNKK